MSKKIAAILSGALVVGLFFQNCSEGVSFESKAIESSNSASGEEVTPSSDVFAPVENTPEIPAPEVCFNGNNSAQCTSDPGLSGAIYYLTQSQHLSQFGGDLNNARLKDYRDYGIQVPVNIVMEQINLAPQNFSNGFQIDNGDYLQTESGEKLIEWFHLDLGGYITLPKGEYQFGTLSDDGVRVWLNEDIIIENDSSHAPTNDCSGLIRFSADETKKIYIEYNQGPRTQIALQLFYRPASEMHKNCEEISNNSVVPKEAFTQFKNF